jgi:hypothetical protein
MPANQVTERVHGAHCESADYRALGGGPCFFPSQSQSVFPCMPIRVRTHYSGYGVGCAYSQPLVGIEAAIAARGDIAASAFAFTYYLTHLKPVRAQLRIC